MHTSYSLLVPLVTGCFSNFKDCPVLLWHLINIIAVVDIIYFSPLCLQSKALKFFTITAQTMESFVKSLSEDMKQQDLDSDENQFVLALAGIVTSK